MPFKRARVWSAQALACADQTTTFEIKLEREQRVVDLLTPARLLRIG